MGDRIGNMFRGLKDYRVVYAHLWRTYGSSWWVRLSFILQLLGRICKLIALPVAVSLIITRLSEQDYEGARDAVLIYIAFSFTLGILASIIKFIGSLGENRIYSDETASYFSRLVHSDIDFFHSNQTGYLTAATRQFVDSSILLLRDARDRYSNTILSIIFPLIVISILDVWLGLVTLGLSVLEATYLLWASHKVQPYRGKSRELYRKLSGEVADAISNVLAIKSAAQEPTYTKRIQHRAEEEAVVFMQKYKLQVRLVAVREALTVSYMLIILWLTVERMSTGAISITVAVLVINYTLVILNGVYALSDDVDAHDDYVDKIIPGFEILHRQNTVADPADPVALKKTQGAVALKNVTFAYDKSSKKPVLHNLSLDIPAKQKIGIVGVSGAGKSTLAKLLLRFDDVDKGQILVDGVDIRHVKQADLRKNIAYVPQEPLLFHVSIKENVMVARPDATDDEVHAALQRAHAMQFVNELPDGIHSIVGERGVKLSGGQKQRIAIARAVLQGAPIIILDEATSALDSESEHIIKNSFSQIFTHKTAIVIAHRLSTLSDMDRIVVLSGGKIVEDGTHQQLLGQNGTYAKLWKRQQKNLET